MPEKDIAPPKKAQTHTSISLTKSDVQTLKDIQQDLRARTDNVKEIRDAVASMKDAGAPLEYAIELLKDDIASFEKAADESIESDAILIRIIDDILDRVEENMAQLCKDREELREDLSAVELRLDAREMRVGARLFRAGVDKSKSFIESMQAVTGAIAQRTAVLAALAAELDSDAKLQKQRLLGGGRRVQEKRVR